MQSNWSETVLFIWYASVYKKTNGLLADIA